MTLEEFILQAREKDVTDDTLKAGVQSLIDSAVKGVYDKVDTTLAAHGLAKPDGTKTLDFLQEVGRKVAGQSDASKELEALRTELEQAKANAKNPAEVEALQKEFEATKAELTRKHTEEVQRLSSQLLASQIDSKMVGLSFKEEHKESAAELLAMYRQNMLNSFKVEGDDMKLKKSDGTFETSGDGTIMTAEMYLRNKLKPFIATEQAGAPKPPAGKATALSGMTTEQIAEYAKANGVDPMTQKGYEWIQQQITAGATDGAAK